jgi:hypothetical protein
MPKAFSEIEPSAVGTAGAAALFSGIPFEHCDFNTAQLQLIFSCGKTTLFEEILPQLEELGGVYYVRSGAAVLFPHRTRQSQPGAAGSLNLGQDGFGRSTERRQRWRP